MNQSQRSPFLKLSQSRNLLRAHLVFTFIERGNDALRAFEIKFYLHGMALSALKKNGIAVEVVIVLYANLIFLLDYGRSSQAHEY